jgi:poly-gamma-glutamate capsule biosynthesis protein CapA/YwtB (metallophosphatase superfamily)
MPAPGTAAPDLSTYPWLYLRDGTPVAAGERVVELIAVGDVMLGRGVAAEPDPLAAVAPWLASADLALGNLECVIGKAGAARPGPYRLRAPLTAAAALRSAGFDLLGLANNHALDYGPQGLAETAVRLQEAGMTPVGAGADAAAAAQPVIREVDDVRLAFLALNMIPDPDDRPGEAGWTRADWDQSQAAAAIAEARADADAVIVSIHWGYEYDLRPDPAQHDAAQAMLDAGAALVIGHHPHVVQGTAAAANSFVAYSLGNLVFDQSQDETRYGLALRAFFDTDGLRAVQALPVRAGPRPRLMAPVEAATLLARVQPPPAQRSTASLAVTGRPSQAGVFHSGEIDLTGDGVPEQVRLDGGRVVILSTEVQLGSASGAGVETWQSLPEWYVVDLALGDPNDDGRAELLLALWKPDKAGVAHSHPFILGYREGAYRVLWGGSAVADPILGVELADLDAEGVQELIVLEQRGAIPAVAAWRWHGWGYTLLWRFPPRP